MSSWTWNYFTLENIFEAKCRLCDKCVRPIINNQIFLLNHIINATDGKHETAINELDKFKFFKDVHWDVYYETLHSTDMLNPKVKCNCCGHEMSIRGGTKTHKRSFIQVSPEMKTHLKKKHKIDENTWIQFNDWLLDNTAYYNKPKIGKMKIYICKACNNDNNESRFKNAIMFVKHMIDKHDHQNEFEKFFSWDKIPKELHRSLPRNEDVDINLQDLSATRRNEGLQPVKDMHVSLSIQLPSDPKDIPCSSRKRKNDTQIEELPNKRKQTNVELIKKYNDKIFILICERNIIIQKLMSTSKKAIFTLTQEIKKILEEMSEDDS